MDFSLITNAVAPRLREAKRVELLRRFGRIMKCGGDVLYSSGAKASIGSRCEIETSRAEYLSAEVIGFDADSLVIMSEQGTRGVVRGSRVYIAAHPPELLMGDSLLGRILNGRGEPIDGLRCPDGRTRWPLKGGSVNPLAKQRLNRAFDSGVCAINSLFTLAVGIRVGLFAGSGVGKTTLLGMISRFSQADVIVVGMIGERGREVREFVEDHLGDARHKAVVIASPADDTALSRIHGAYRAAAVAEFFRSRQRNVLLIVDSLTRLAMALREVALAAGEPPAMRGYPASVFGNIAAYVERAGAGIAGEGAITAIYTVLVEGDDHVADPISDVARSVLDGHIVLSRAIAEAEIFPPIDVGASLSRVMAAVVSEDHMAKASRFRALWSHKREKQDALDFGAYSPGRDSVLDEALQKAPAMDSLLRQGTYECVDFEASLRKLNNVM